jgi:small subunit ribosomal protein S6
MERRSSMRKYETIFIAHPDLVEEEVKGLTEKMKGIIESLNGQLIKVEEWGRRKLAYKLKKLTKGYYILIRFLGDGQILAEIERNLRLSDGVLKYQSVRLDEQTPEEEEAPAQESLEGKETEAGEGDEPAKEVEG